MECQHTNISKILSGKWSALFIHKGLTYNRYRCLNCNKIGARPPKDHPNITEIPEIDWAFDNKGKKPESLHEKLDHLLQQTFYRQQIERKRRALDKSRQA